VFDGGLNGGRGVRDGYQSLFSGGLRCPFSPIAVAEEAVVVILAGEASVGQISEAAAAALRLAVAAY